MQKRVPEIAAPDIQPDEVERNRVVREDEPVAVAHPPEDLLPPDHQGQPVCVVPHISVRQVEIPA